jgi:hypothetical protein
MYILPTFFATLGLIFGGMYGVKNYGSIWNFIKRCKQLIPIFSSK